MERPRAGTDEDRHVAYLRQLLEAARSPGSGGEFLYVTRTEGQPGFWELVGFRATGLTRSLLGAIHFQAQSDDPLLFARRSFGHYLSAPPQEVGLDRETFPAALIPLRAPFPDESVPDLLGRLKRGEPTAPLYLDAAHVEVAFDFRPANPSLQRSPGEAARSRRLAFRSREGHVITGTTLNLGARLRRASAFLALTGVRQHLPGRALELPTLVVHRSFLTMMSESAEGELDFASLPHAFSPDSANPLHLLDPRLDTGAAPASGDETRPA
jgi:hypothetical protein